MRPAPAQPIGMVYVPRFNLRRESTPALVLGLVFFSALGMMFASDPILEYFRHRARPREDLHREFTEYARSLETWTGQPQQPLPPPPEARLREAEPQRTVSNKAWSRCASGLLILWFTVRPITRELRWRRKHASSAPKPSPPNRESQF